MKLMYFYPLLRDIKRNHKKFMQKYNFESSRKNMVLLPVDFLRPNVSLAACVKFYVCGDPDHNVHARALNFFMI